MEMAGTDSSIHPPSLSPAPNTMTNADYDDNVIITRRNAQNLHPAAATAAAAAISRTMQMLHEYEYRHS